MILAAEDAIPKKKVNYTNKYRIHWWDDDVAKSVQARRKAFSLYCSNPTFENYMEARQKRAETRNFIPPTEREHAINGIASEVFTCREMDIDINFQKESTPGLDNIGYIFFK
ncbi:hypothetical protein HHI36_016916 [Cryptolaemus montrouzieri]|uniref:Uncharacterized protein n=1 Tax=Cryptolaemus montrouzieri TaxID=559131 RepID=A0ABD2NLF2_9CUCU